MQKTLQNLYVFCSIMISIIYLSGCASTKPSVCSDHPGWVEKGGGFFSDNLGSVVYGVGSTDLTENIGTTMMMTSADTRARVDVARTITTHTEDLVKIYQGFIRDIEADEVEEWIRAATVQFTNLDLPGSAIIDRHYCGGSDAYYSLAKMDVEQFKEMIDKVEKLSERAKEAIKLNAQEMFDEMVRRSEAKEYE